MISIAVLLDDKSTRYGGGLIIAPESFAAVIVLQKSNRLQFLIFNNFHDWKLDLICRQYATKLLLFKWLEANSRIRSRLIGVASIEASPK